MQHVEIGLRNIFAFVPPLQTIGHDPDEHHEDATVTWPSRDLAASMVVLPHVQLALPKQDRVFAFRVSFRTPRYIP
jgi:hypothetical protein